MSLVLTGYAPAAQNDLIVLPANFVYDRIHGAWLGQLIGNFTGLPTEGRYRARPNPANSVPIVTLPIWLTDDDTSMEWVDLHILEEHGLDVTYAQVRQEWMDHFNDAIWVANAEARALMDEGLVPPDTGSREHNIWWYAIDAQIETEVFGMMAPGMGRVAQERAAWFARVTNDGYAVDAAAFYAIMYARAFVDADPRQIVSEACDYFPPDSMVVQIASDVLAWSEEYPDWRDTRREIFLHYGDRPWYTSRPNFAATLMAVLYGEGDFEQTLTIATLAGWDNDCNAATTAGFIGALVGYSGLPTDLTASSGDSYQNVNRSGLEDDSVSNIAARTQALAEQVILLAGGRIEGEGDARVYYIPAN
jgi:ADP-ribosylglycohydrolase